MRSEVDAAFCALYEQTWRRVWAHILAKCSSTHDASDILQETYLELYRLMRRRGVNYIQNGEAMAVKIASQKISRHYTMQEKLRHLLPLTRETEDGGETEIDDAALTALSAEEVAMTNLTLAEVQAYLDRQDEELRRIFLLRFQLDLSVSEIAGLLGMSRSRVKNRLYRTLGELKAHLTDGKETNK